ncbi:recombinase family protein [Caballeronia sp. AZ7_KS35]|uniref:recombinase family protein n=1 Tax=Caballeronia sp. AZ7_KS35 TaxID=2921762 RepID=UPI002028CF50|nr:recombinase family protein [Caballeronia sp. AZ7_KS35]
MKAYSYLRFSTPEQAQGDSFRRQTALAEAYAVEHGLELDTGLRFADQGVSAFRGKNAATGALRLFLRAVEDGDIDSDCFLLVESLDRISRSVVTEAQGLFLSIISMGVTLVTLADRKEYSKAAIDRNPMDLIMSLLVMIRAHEESLTKSTRLKQAWIGKRAKVQEGGHILTSKAPGWLRLGNGEFEVVEDRASVVRQVFQWTLNGQGKEAIARTLNEQGVSPFGRASHWHASYIHKVLTNPAVIGTLTTGTLEHVDGKAQRQPLDTIPNYYPPIIDQETFSRVQALKATSTKTKGRAVVQNVLAGLAVCPECGSRMTRVTKGATTKAGKPYLVCSKAKGGAGCMYRAVRLDAVEHAIGIGYSDIEEAVVSYGSEGLAKEVDSLQGAQWHLEDQLEELVNTITEIGRSPALTKRLREVEAEHANISKILKEKSALLGTKSIQARLTGLRGALDGGAVSRVNVALRELFSAVVVRYATGDLILSAHIGATVVLPYEWHWGGET